ncbi:hypothetical protein JTF06_06165 [Desemzia sp. RIT804]|uniref:DUF6612 family protein n=1 Tax=Desemzia sp. RIT 804 TaxID=2810209 RepID=UPI0019522EED|nr:DUF6612 family protein [Desemzia sp. RIT 804]MBM6614472.1 hypothetical protein [Desemzia sp. RIT 804]
MKKSVLSSVLVATFLLMGCEQSLSSEEVVTEVKANQETVENYQAVIELAVSITNQDSGEVIQESNSDTEIAFDETNLDNYGTISASDGTNTMEQEHYSIGDEAYLNINGQGWMDVSAQQESLFQNTGTTYEHLVPIVETISKVGEMTEDEDSYIYSFQGVSEELYSVLESPYSLSFGTVPPNEVEHDATLVIDKETLIIEELNSKLSGEQEGHELLMNIKHAYDNMNKMNDMTIPQEIIDAAANPQ